MHTPITIAATTLRSIAADEAVAEPTRFVQTSRDRRVARVEGGEIHIKRGLMSRTGRVLGHVDQGLCVEIAALRGETPLSTERLYALDCYDPTARNSIGTLGAYCNQNPVESEIDAAVDRAREVLAGTREPQFGLNIRIVAAA